MHRYLDPASSLIELLSGLIMTLTFTLGAGIIIQDEGREGARQLLIAVVGCNIAWGLIDGALHLLSRTFERGRLRRLAQAVGRAADPKTAHVLVASELDELLGKVLSAGERETLYARIATNLQSVSVPRNSIDRVDVLGAFTIFWLFVLATLPAAIPFLFIDDLFVAVRASNAILLVLLFITGYWWARYTLGRPWLVGLGLLLFGALLVVAAIPLGG